MKKETIVVQYAFTVSVEHKDHILSMINELKKNPINKLLGAGIINGKAYSYSCIRKGDGKIVERSSRNPTFKSFKQWFKNNENLFHQGQYSDEEIAYAAFLEGVDVGTGLDLPSQ